MKRINSISELMEVLYSQDKYIYKIDTAEECNKNLTVSYYINKGDKKEHYCGKFYTGKIRLSYSSVYIVINGWVFHYKNISYMEKEIENINIKF